jgi:hypothetical protein
VRSGSEGQGTAELKTQHGQQQDCEPMWSCLMGAREFILLMWARGIHLFDMVAGVRPCGFWGRAFLNNYLGCIISLLIFTLTTFDLH